MRLGSVGPAIERQLGRRVSAAPQPRAARAPRALRPLVLARMDAALAAPRPRRGGPGAAPLGRSPVAPPAAVAAWLGTLGERLSRVQPERGEAAAPTAHAPTARVLAPAAPRADAPGATADAAAAPAPARAPVLIHQRLSVRQSRYAVPRMLHPQASQLVGLLFTLIGAPAFTPAVPGVRHPNSEGKYELLRLLWQRAERQLAAGGISSAGDAWPGSSAGGGSGGGEAGVPGDAEEADWLAREAAMASTMTLHLRESLRKVLADPLVPRAARDVAAARLAERETRVGSGLRSWFDAAAVRPDFVPVVLPLLRMVLGALEGVGLDTTADTRGSPGSAASGDAMEAATMALVEAQLPAGWSLLSKAHVVALDGRHPGHAAACKWEVDLVALDESGTAVAIFEAKLANANPLMTLLNDAGR
ncbi:MAG: hypothetical protein J3K34DRAFT_164680 [Monoraphidium minutum]|nr:MAG: hypothetical protein J3K34DRAFT_164680 [Monoraphidium minutum]